jgi:hypothetical protein
MSADPTDLRSQDKQRDDAQQRARLQAENEAEDFKWLMANKRGRRIIWRLLERTGVFRTSFRLNNEMAFLEGQRNVGLILLDAIHAHCPDAYLTMLKEHQSNG